MTEPKGRKITELEVFETMLQRAEITYRKKIEPPDEELGLPSYVTLLVDELEDRAKDTRKRIAVSFDEHWRLQFFSTNWT
jgi:hypothetical protein